jgi:hypothetical protein
MAETTVHPNLQKFLDRARDFLTEVEDLYVTLLGTHLDNALTRDPLSTPGKDLESRLNQEYGPGNQIYDDFAALIRQGVVNNEGWVAVDEVDGPNYRRTRISPPSAETRHFSITAVYINSQDVFRGQYHLHPYGEINCVIPLDDDAELMGMSGWQKAGWTSPGPGTHHYPEVRGGALVALFFLPAGRISYKIEPGRPQPVAI